MEEIIKDFYHRIIGYIKTDAQGNKEAFDYYRRFLGRYIKDDNVTKDFYNRIVARGDTTTALIYEAENKNEMKRLKRSK